MLEHPILDQAALLHGPLCAAVRYVFHSILEFSPGSKGYSNTEYGVTALVVINIFVFTHR